jgi:glycosyltransferase involved in cell wall biosynthesis
MRVGIVSFEFEGVTRNGGIGTAYRLLAETLAASGAQVTVLLTQRSYAEADFKRGQAQMRELGIELEAVPAPARYSDGNPWFVGQSYAVCERLRAHSFDVVHFPENIGTGYHSVLTKKLGLDFKRTLFVAGLHGSTPWVREASQEAFPSVEDSLLFELEKRSVEMADIVVSPSEYMLGYVREIGWNLPAESFALPNVNRLATRTQARMSSGEPARQIVFFGRLEARKGIYLFLEAVQHYLRKFPEAPVLPLVFLGKDSILGTGERASAFVRRELAGLASRLRIQFKSDLTSAAAIRYLREHPESLVCMPSPVDNSPYVIVEALEEGFNFISSAKGGQGELIHAEDHGQALFEPEAAKLAETFHERLYEKAPRIRPNPALARASSRWVELHREWVKRVREAPKAAGAAQNSEPLVSVCLAPAREGQGLRPILESLELGLHSHVEVLVEADHQMNGELDDLEIRVRRLQTRKSPSWMARFAAEAKGRYVLFLDDVAGLQAHTIQLLIQLAEEQGLERLTSVFIRVSPEGRSQTVIPTPEHALANVLRFDPRVPLLFMDRKRFLAEIKGTDCTDPALWMLDSLILGREFHCVPKPLVRTARWMPTSTELRESHFRACQRVAAHVPAALSGLATSLAHARHATQKARDQLAAKERTIELIKRTFGGPQAHA